MENRTAISLVILLLSCTSFAGAANRVALVIGVDQYSKLDAAAQLRVAVSDANLIAKTLKNLPEPFSVILLQDAGREEVSRAFDRFVDEAKNAE